MERQGTAVSRRNFLKGGIGPMPTGIRPPGVEEAALMACTGCGACVADCPSHIIRLVDRLPLLDFSIGECTFCGACAQSCPEPVFTGATAIRFDHVVAIAASCLPLQRVDCQACRDACSADAIRFRPMRGGPFVPELSTELCTGCGACITVCPVGAVATVARAGEAAHG